MCKDNATAKSKAEPYTGYNMWVINKEKKDEIKEELKSVKDEKEKETSKSLS